MISPPRRCHQKARIAVAAEVDLSRACVHNSCGVISSMPFTSVFACPSFFLHWERDNTVTFLEFVLFLDIFFNFYTCRLRLALVFFITL